MSPCHPGGCVLWVKEYKKKCMCVRECGWGWMCVCRIVKQRNNEKVRVCVWRRERTKERKTKREETKCGMCVKRRVQVHEEGKKRKKEKRGEESRGKNDEEWKDFLVQKFAHPNERLQFIFSI